MNIPLMSSLNTENEDSTVISLENPQFEELDQSFYNGGLQKLHKKQYDIESDVEEVHVTSKGTILKYKTGGYIYEDDNLFAEVDPRGVEYKIVLDRTLFDDMIYNKAKDLVVGLKVDSSGIINVVEIDNTGTEIASYSMGDHINSAVFSRVMNTDYSTISDKGFFIAASRQFSTFETDLQLYYNYDTSPVLRSYVSKDFDGLDFHNSVCFFSSVANVLVVNNNTTNNILRVFFNSDPKPGGATFTTKTVHFNSVFFDQYYNIPVAIGGINPGISARYDGVTSHITFQNIYYPNILQNIALENAYSIDITNIKTGTGPWYRYCPIGTASILGYKDSFGYFSLLAVLPTVVQTSTDNINWSVSSTVQIPYYFTNALPLPEDPLRINTPDDLWNNKGINGNIFWQSFITANGGSPTASIVVPSNDVASEFVNQLNICINNFKDDNGRLVYNNGVLSNFSTAYWPPPPPEHDLIRGGVPPQVLRKVNNQSYNVFWDYEKPKPFVGSGIITFNYGTTQLLQVNLNQTTNGTIDLTGKP